MIECVRRSTLNITNLNTTNKRKGKSRLYHIVDNDRTTTVATKWKLGFAGYSSPGVRALPVTMRKIMFPTRHDPVDHDV